MNLLAGVSTGTPLMTKGDAGVITYDVNIDKNQESYMLGYDSDDRNYTMTVSYLMTNQSERTPLHVAFTTKKGGKDGELISTYDFAVNIPIWRNYLTTLTGNLLATAASIKVLIGEDFIEEYNNHKPRFALQNIAPKRPAVVTSVRDGGTITTYRITDREEMIWVFDNPDELGTNRVSKLGFNVDMNGTDWYPTGPYAGAFGGPYGTFDGNGHALRNFSVQKSLYKISGFFRRKQQTGAFGM